MKTFLICAIAAVSLFAMVSEAQAQSVQGTVTYVQANGQTFPAPGFLMRFCRADPSRTPPISSSCTNTFTFADGTYGTGLSPGDYYVFIWRHDVFWGSETYPFALVRIFAVPFQVLKLLQVRPRALPPNAVTPPNNSVNRPTSFTLQWTDGLDSVRRNPNWPVTYDIYASGNEFPENLVFSNIPCNGFGTCSINVSGLVYSTRYQWRVVARMGNVGIFPGFADNGYLTSSNTFRFSTMFDPSTPTYSFRTSNGRYLTAPGGGGGDFTATATSIDSLISQFKIIDVNGGSLMHGDTVHIQTNRNYYLMAFGGGGGDVATSGWAMSWETFTILKVNGSGSIGGGDAIALRGLNGVHHLVAEGGGGGTVNCNRTAIGPFETFTLVQQ